jgi:hypothetical protein
MGSWKRDIGAVNAISRYRAENRKEKIFSLSFSPSQPFFFPVGQTDEALP